MSKVKPVYVPIHPSMKRKLKIEAAKRGKTVIKYTEELGTDLATLEEIFYQQKSKKKNSLGGLDFGF